MVAAWGQGRARRSDPHRVDDAGCASVAGGRVTLGFSDQVVDTRSGLGVFAAGAINTVVLPSNAVLTVSVFALEVEGRAFVLPCGSAIPNPVPPQPVVAVPPAALYFRAGETVTNTVTTGPSPSCLAATTPVHITVYHRGDITAVQGTGA